MIAPVVLKLVMLVCMNSDCSVENAYEVDTFRGDEMQAMDDCRPLRDARRTFYSAANIHGVEFHCWTPDEITKSGFN